ncbi:hypothetical protein R9C00_10895 [Flammeovirgaceae bacterium SG7u.111]|nr:hypothetical protein [Flammeovirgaceae bacterium SG7u.132]WPO37957.1 hypothetical protein R9C00_10895 [Flammeovirgaceae bacterium SG7u.111]
MPSAFWILEDGRTFSSRWSGLNYVLEYITDELKDMPGAEEFYEYLEEFVYREEKYDSSNGYGGFIRDEEDIMFNFDLRTFAPKNRRYFWEAAQNALINRQGKKASKKPILNSLLLMHEAVERGEDPMLLNNSSIVHPDPNEKHGPGW